LTWRLNWTVSDVASERKKMTLNANERDIGITEIFELSDEAMHFVAGGPQEANTPP